MYWMVVSYLFLSLPSNDLFMAVNKTNQFCYSAGLHITTFHICYSFEAENKHVILCPVVFKHFVLVGDFVFKQALGMVTSLLRPEMGNGRNFYVWVSISVFDEFSWTGHNKAKQAAAVDLD